MIKYREDRLNNKNKKEIDNRIQIPSITVEFLDLLDTWYENSFETNSSLVNTPEYWKKAGVIEMMNKVRQILKQGK